jgi:two-component system NtrC family sensor kinase
MKRRSRTGEPAKARHRKTVTRKRRNAPKARRRRSSFAGTHQTEIARVIRERDEALKQQTATAEVLKVISRSTFDLKTVLTTLTESAARLCAADFGLIFQQVGGVLRLVANFGFSREAERYWLEHPLPTDRGSSTGRALLEGRAIHIPDVLADPEYRATRYQELAGYRSVLSVPLVRDGTTIGLFGLGRAEVRPFTDKQIELVTTFADQAVIAIENVRLFEAEQQRTRELTESLEQQTATSEVLRVISSYPGDLQPAFDAMLQKAARICDAKFGNIFRWDGESLHLAATYNTPPAFSQLRSRAPLRPSPENPLGRLVATKGAVHVADLAAEQLYTERRDPNVVDAVEVGGIRTFVAVPMLKENELIGAIIVYRQEVRPFNDKQIALVTSFAAHRHRHREHAAAKRASRIAAAANCHRRRAQGHQPFDVRFTDRTGHPRRDCGEAVRGTPGSYLQTGRRLLSRGRFLQRLSGARRFYQTPPHHAGTTHHHGQSRT